MTAAQVPRVEVRGLDLGTELGSGGQGTVTAVRRRLINDQWPAVLKRYSAGVAQNLDTAVLERFVEFPGQLSPGDSAWLYEHTSWPAEVAENSGVACGFLMRAVPDAYYFGFRTRTGGTRPRLAEVGFLLNSDDYVRSSGLSVSDSDRLGLLADLASVLTRLHALGVVVGDLSPKNLLFSLAPVPSCFVIDCDAMRVRGESLMKQLQTGDWEVPAGEVTATLAADAYKFALLAIRLFARDQSSSDPAALAALSPKLGRLAVAALHHDPSRRPAPQDWIPALTARRSNHPAAAPVSPHGAPAVPPPSTRRPRSVARFGADAPGPARPRFKRTAWVAVVTATIGVLAVLFVVLGAYHLFSTSNASGPVSLRWSYRTNSPNYAGNYVDFPAVADGTVYIGSEDDRIYALDAANGQLRWSYTTGGIYNGVTVADGNVYLGSDDDKVYALDAANGQLRWSYTTGGSVESSPAVAGGIVYVGSFDDKVYALDAANGHLRWSYTTGGSVVSSPAVAGGIVYVGSFDDKVYALDAANGDLRWSYTTGGAVFSSPAVAGGIVYVGSEDDKVYALDTANGDLRWSYTTGGAVFSSPAVAGGIVYVGSDDHKVYALDTADGHVRWSYTTGDKVDSSPAVASGIVYVGSQDDKVYALDTADGHVRWSYTTGDIVVSKPTVADGIVYVGSYDGELYALDTAR